MVTSGPLQSKRLSSVLVCTLRVLTTRVPGVHKEKRLGAQRSKEPFGNDQAECVKKGGHERKPGE